ncbi:MAG: ATP-dependent Clp protease proteolytic subunit [Akkermansiaceae bacterium]|nr:ATP-dependent Clp protease proteolytic subunit [Akkermansiaceae bacterium]
MKLPTTCVLVGLSLSAFGHAKEASAGPSAPGAAVPPAVPAEPVATPPAPPAPKPAPSPSSETEALSTKNKLEAERLTAETNKLRAEITRLKMERELITERLALDAAKKAEAELKGDADKEKLTKEGEIAKLRADKLTNDLKSLQTEAMLELTKLQNDISLIETTEKRAKFADAKPVYLEKPLRDDGVLVISDRRIPLNGMIVPATADYITSRIDYWNNKDKKLPIFIVIDDCPGGSVMAGYRILKSMEASEAPIHVVVKSFAASMAACITTLAEESYCYPNSLILHHQISSQLMFARLNLTQQKEFYQDSQRWWERLASPVAAKMGISTDDFIKKMYEKASGGDWSEFGDKAQELKWVNHILTGIEETSLNKDPDTTEKPKPAAAPAAFEETVDADGKPCMFLPRLNPKDVYFLYNPDGYYRVR